MKKTHPDLVTVLGHTAAGKTAFAAHLAARIGGEVISADSRQVYRGMDIGTGKDYSDYVVGGIQIPFHLVDIVDAGEAYNVYRFREDFRQVYDRITGEGKVPVMCGGTGLYLEAVLRNYRLIGVPVDQELRSDLENRKMDELEEMLRSFGPLHNITDTVSRERLIRAIEIARYRSANPDAGEDLPAPESLVLGIRYERNRRRGRITERLRTRLSAGMVEEVRQLLERGVTPAKMDYYGLEYRYITRYILNELTYEAMFEQLNTAIHRFAKRQMTYFRGMERRGVKIHWIGGEEKMEDQLEKALSLFDGSGQGII